MRLDLHVHSVRSPDSALALPEIVDALGPAGLQGFALTDHNTVAGHDGLAKLQDRYPRYRFIPGVEVSTREGHLLVYGTSELPPVHRPLAETLEWTRARGLVTVLAHPLRWTHGVGARLAAAASVSGVEAMNGHNREVANARASLLASSRGIAETGGSDAHLPGEVGRAFTEFPEEAETVEELLATIAQHRCRGAGRSSNPSETARIALRSAWLRARRGFRRM